MRWLFVGAGNMASSLIGGLLGAGANAGQIAVIDPDEQACQRAEKTYGVLNAGSIEKIIPALFANADADDRQLGVVIAVKPHIVKPVCQSFTHYMGNTDAQHFIAIDPLFISIAAGVRESSMRSWLPPAAPLVRCMPNTPALLGLGATALYANIQCTEREKQLAEELLNSAGIAIWVDEESVLDAVTAVSGSGPAYFFYLIEHMIEAGVEMGLPRDTAETLATQTAYGAASMARQGDLSAAVLRENVTSKGGTTAAALQVFNDSGTPSIIKAALLASQLRATELGDELA